MMFQDDHILAMAPNDQIYDFKGKFVDKFSERPVGLSVENTAWANTVVASAGYMLGIVINTGKETRMSMNMKVPRQKTGKVDLEINWLTKVLFVNMLILAMVIISAEGFVGEWYLKYFKIVLILSSIIPISMKISLDFAKVYYSYSISTDADIAGCIPRTTTIPEELGRI